MRPESFQTTEQTLDLVPLPVQCFVVLSGMLAALCGLDATFRSDPSTLLANPGGVVGGGGHDGSHFAATDVREQLLAEFPRREPDRPAVSESAAGRSSRNRHGPSCSVRHGSGPDSDGCRLCKPSLNAPTKMPMPFLTRPATADSSRPVDER